MSGQRTSEQKATEADRALELFDAVRDRIKAVREREGSGAFESSSILDLVECVAALELIVRNDHTSIAMLVGVADRTADLLSNTVDKLAGVSRTLEARTEHLA